MNDKEKIIAKLKEENEYLKSLLQVHNISFEKPKEIKRFGFSDNEKIKTYISYFVGRDDIFAYEYYSKEGKRGFSPACLGRNNLTGYCPNICSECVNKQANDYKRLKKMISDSKKEIIKLEKAVKAYNTNC